MSGFVVDSRTLVAVRDTLGQLNEQLVGMHTVIWHQWGTLGGRALESELEHFCGTWHYGVTELGGQLQDLTRRLSEAAAAYDRIEQHIVHAGGGSSSTGGVAPTPPAGSGHTTSGAHHTAKHSTPKHASKAHSEPSPAKHHSASGGGGRGGAHYSGGAGLVGAPSGAGNTGHSGESHGGGDKHGGDKHPGVGSGTTVIGGGPTQTSSSGSGSGTTTIDEKIHRAEEHQRAELASVLHMVKG
jgi:hypothetical protein